MTSTTTTTVAIHTDERDAILEALQAWIHQRPGLDPRNYISGWSDVNGRKAYFAEKRQIERDLREARTLLRAVAWRELSITADDLKAAFRDAYSGRLSWDGTRLDYCTGQYWPTEYRKAACAVLASALWNATRKAYPSLDGNGLRAQLRSEFGRSIAARWFS